MTAGRLTLASITLLAVVTTAAAQDQVVLKRARLAGQITVFGAIEDYTGDELRIRSGESGTLRTYPAADVVSVVTPQAEPHDRGLSLLRKNKVEDAIRELEAALKKESRAWVRREILATLVQCELRQGDYRAAGTRFLALVKSDPTSRHFRMIPLVWAAEPLTPEVCDEATAWLNGTIDAGRLMGASLLLEAPPHAAAARVALRELAINTDRRIQTLAQMQAWRLDAAKGTIGDLEIARWQERVDALPPDLRAGPSYLLGQAYAARHDYELAAATLLWLPLVDDHDFRLSARACLAAGVALGRIGQHVEAHGLFLEVTQRYAETSSASTLR